MISKTNARKTHLKIVNLDYFLYLRDKTTNFDVAKGHIFPISLQKMMRPCSFNK